nr:YbjN domain-containing protein [uncultured Butyricicoccus sp.]
MLSRQKLEAYLQGEQIEYHLDESDADRIVVIFQTQCLSNVSLDITILNNRTVLFLSRMPLSIPTEHRLAVCEYITRVNYGVILGGFEMDLDEGDVNYKIVSALGRETEIDREAFCRLLYLGNSMFDKYAPGILAILYGGMSAAEAYQSLTKSKN